MPLSQSPCSWNLHESQQNYRIFVTNQEHYRRIVPQFLDSIQTFRFCYRKTRVEKGCFPTTQSGHCSPFRRAKPNVYHRLSSGLALWLTDGPPWPGYVLEQALAIFDYAGVPVLTMPRSNDRFGRRQNAIISCLEIAVFNFTLAVRV